MGEVNVGVRTFIRIYFSEQSARTCSDVFGRGGRGGGGGDMEASIRRKRIVQLAESYEWLEATIADDMDK